MTTLSQARAAFINDWRGPDLTALHAIPRQDCERLARELRDEWPEAPPVRRPAGVDVGRAALIGWLRRDPHAAGVEMQRCLEAGTALSYHVEYGVDVCALAPRGPKKYTPATSEEMVAGVRAGHPPDPPPRCGERWAEFARMARAAAPARSVARTPVELAADWAWELGHACGGGRALLPPDPTCDDLARAWKVWARVDHDLMRLHDAPGLDLPYGIECWTEGPGGGPIGAEPGLPALTHTTCTGGTIFGVANTWISITRPHSGLQLVWMQGDSECVDVRRLGSEGLDLDDAYRLIEADDMTGGHLSDLLGCSIRDALRRCPPGMEYWWEQAAAQVAGRDWR